MLVVRNGENLATFVFARGRADAMRKRRSAAFVEAGTCDRTLHVLRFAARGFAFRCFPLWNSHFSSPAPLARQLFVIGYWIFVAEKTQHEQSTSPIKLFYSKARTGTLPHSDSCFPLQTQAIERVPRAAFLPVRTAAKPFIQVLSALGAEPPARFSTQRKMRKA